MKRSPLRPMSRKRRRASAGRAEIRAAVFARDGQHCRLAGVTDAGRCFGGLTPHHIVKASQGGPYTEENLVTLCSLHNSWVEDNPNHARALGLVRRGGLSA